MFAFSNGHDMGSINQLPKSVKPGDRFSAGVNDQEGGLWAALAGTLEAMGSITSTTKKKGGGYCIVCHTRDR